MAIFQKKKTLNSEKSNVQTVKLTENKIETVNVHHRFPTVSLIRPLITEKTRDLATKENKYVFLIKKNSNKKEIKKAIENLYKVEVTNINIINVKPKPKRLGRNLGKGPHLKKAIITIRKGQSIDVIPT